MDELYSQICWKIDDNQHTLLQRFISGLGETVSIGKDSGDAVAATSSNTQHNDLLESSAVDPSPCNANAADVDYTALLNREFTADASI
uniref:Uncharacterized protein n=1 Tax=Romanomermis culicivorax TaxID=13658 RepID=A0A915HGG8_ROMCU